ncbi:hypothetical protein EJ110_NYTH17001 [Nymphaea thermarum]|nr:hypothetical protein EJ110_NYTH17001 [Nymphaea thermarum]
MYHQVQTEIDDTTAMSSDDDTDDLMVAAATIAAAAVANIGAWYHEPVPLEEPCEVPVFKDSDFKDEILDVHDAQFHEDLREILLMPENQEPKDTGQGIEEEIASQLRDSIANAMHSIASDLQRRLLLGSSSGLRS